MKHIAWLTDLHMDFLDAHKVDAFCQSVAHSGADAVLLGGDISNASGIREHLLLFERHLRRPIYFVLGNHDFYGGSIAGIRSIVAGLARDSRRLHWLPGSGIVELAENTGLVGHGGWADGRLGNAVRSEVLLNDYFYIDEFIGLDRERHFVRLNALGDECADYLGNVIKLRVPGIPRAFPASPVASSPSHAPQALCTHRRSRTVHESERPITPPFQIVFPC